jgi:hypothetical protein
MASSCVANTNPSAVGNKWFLLSQIREWLLSQCQVDLFVGDIFSFVFKSMTDNACSDRSSRLMFKTVSLLFSILTTQSKPDAFHVIPYDEYLLGLKSRYVHKTPAFVYYYYYYYYYYHYHHHYHGLDHLTGSIIFKTFLNPSHNLSLQLLVGRRQKFLVPVR